MSHAGLVAQEGSQMDRLGAVILWESLYLGAVAAGPLLGVEGHRPMAGGTKLTVRLQIKPYFRTSAHIESSRKNNKHNQYYYITPTPHPTKV